MRMNPVEIIAEFYEPESETHFMMIQHGYQVGSKALEVANRVLHLHPDKDFIWEAAMLHDIAVFMTDAPSIGCHGEHPYVAHGHLGRKILEEKGLIRHALVCERHVGVGLTVVDIKNGNLPLPEYDMAPVSLEEKIVCYADKFFSKNPEDFGREKSVDEIISKAREYGEDIVERFIALCTLFGDR